MKQLNRALALSVAVLAIQLLTGCASLVETYTSFQVDESEPDLSHYRLPLVEEDSNASVLSASEILNMPIEGMHTRNSRFWTLISVEPMAVKIAGVYVDGTVLEQKNAYGNDGTTTTGWWGQQGAFFPGTDLRGSAFIPADKLRGRTGRRMFDVKNRAMAVELENKDHYFTIDSIGELRSRRLTINEVPLTLEGGMPFTFKVDQSGNVIPLQLLSHVGVDQISAKHWGSLISNLSVKYIGGSKPAADRFEAVHQGTFYIEELLGPVNGANWDRDVSRYKGEMQALERKIESLTASALRHEQARLQQAADMAREKELSAQREEAAEKAAIEREKAAIARAEADRKRQAYLATPEGRAETAARLAREREQARLYRVARAAERAKWPTGAVGKLSRGALVCTSVTGAAVASAYGRSNKDCDSVYGDSFISSMYDSGHGRNIKIVELIGGGQWYVNGSDIEQ